VTVTSLPAFAAGVALGAVVAVVRLVRRPRPIHPHGLVLHGAISPARSVGARSSGIEWIDAVAPGSVEARLSRGIGVPVPVPDIWGLAFRQVDARAGDASGPRPGVRSGDVLLSSVAGAGPVGRFVPIVRLSPWGAGFSTVMPYRSTDGPILVAARTQSGAPASASVVGQATELARRPWVLDLVWASPRGRWTRFATLTLSAPGPSAGDRADLRFDPVLSPPTGAGTYAWTRMLREPSYRAARRSRRPPGL
jgi:hypothetical protein